MVRSLRITGTALRYLLWITRGSIVSISAARSASAAANSFAASFAVLPFEPHTTTPPSNAATAAAIAPGSNRIAPTSSAASTMPLPAMATRDGEDKLAAILDLGSKLFDVRPRGARSRRAGRRRFCSHAKFNTPET